MVVIVYLPNYIFFGDDFRRVFIRTADGDALVDALGAPLVSGVLLQHFTAWRRSRAVSHVPPLSHAHQSRQGEREGGVIASVPPSIPPFLLHSLPISFLFSLYSFASFFVIVFVSSLSSHLWRLRSGVYVGYKSAIMFWLDRIVAARGSLPPSLSPRPFAYGYPDACGYGRDGGHDPSTCWTERVGGRSETFCASILFFLLLSIFFVCVEKGEWRKMEEKILRLCETLA